MGEQAEAVGAFGANLKHAGEGYRAADEAAGQVLRAIETKLAALR
jgi:hypothetical protein